MNLNELTRDEIQIITFGLQDHIVALDGALEEFKGMPWANPVKNARLDTKILLDKFQEALDNRPFN